MAAVQDWAPPKDMDPECVALCVAINKLPGLRTTESCCGHGKHGFWIWLVADDVASLVPLNYWLDRCHSGHYGWQLAVSTDCSHDPESVRFWIQGPTDAEGYKQADEIAALIEEKEVVQHG